MSSLLWPEARVFSPQIFQELLVWANWHKAVIFNWLQVLLM